MKFETLACAALLLAGSLSAETFTSPNGLVSCDFSLRDGVPVAVVSFNGRRVFESELGYVCERLEQRGAAEAKTVKRTWKPVWGFRSVYPENYAERTVNLGVPGEARAKETLVLRCYDEGFAVQAKLATDAYCLNEIRGERTSWKFADGARAWCIPETEATFPQDPTEVAALDFGFLPAGRDYALTLWRDAQPDEAAEPPRGYVRETRVVRCGDVVKVPMASAGGFVATLAPSGK